MNARITVFTPTYNRANVLTRVYESLKKQTYKDFVWIIVDDGSTDNTKSVVDKFISDNLMEIIYIYQKNMGKHNAINQGVKNADSELFLIADSDDAFVPEALETFVKTWDSIDTNIRNEYKGVIARTFDSETKKVNGGKFPQKQFDANELDANFKLKTTGEKWSIFRTEVLKEFPFPNIEGLKFYPETIIWQKMSRKYKTRYIDIPLREYYRDQENAITSNKNKRYKENIYLWEHIINNIFDYFFYNPILFIKAFVGLVRDGLANKYSIKKIISIPNTFFKKIFTLIVFPIGYVLYKNMTLE